MSIKKLIGCRDIRVVTAGKLGAKERPIIFSAPMIRAILDGRKTQTRRVLKWCCQIPPECTAPECVDNLWYFNEPKRKGFFPGSGILCPYGAPGDRLWVRETFGLWAHSFDSVGIEYAAGEEDKIETFDDRSKMPSLEVVCKRRMGGGRIKRPSIFMPRWASRITLEIVSVRVERLQDISEEDAKAEGAISIYAYNGFRDGFALLWDSINGKTYPWSSNPFVWVIGFRNVTNEMRKDAK